MKYKHVYKALFIIALVGLGSLAIGWCGFRSREIAIGRISSWDKLPVPPEAFLEWGLEDGQAQGVFKYRYDEFFVTGKSEAESLEKFSRKNGLMLSKQSHLGLPDCLKNAVSYLHISPSVIRELESKNAWIFHGSINSQTYIIAKYAPSHKVFLSNFLIMHGVQD